MTIKFHPNIKHLLLGKGILYGFAANSAVTVYTGVQPTAADIVANWANYNRASPDFLGHFMDGKWTQPQNGNLLQLTALGAAVADQSGIASWAILWADNIDGLAMDGVTLPAPKFIVVSASLMTENGVVRFDDTTFIAASSKTVTDCSLSCV